MAKVQQSVVTKLINDPVNQRQQAYGSKSNAPMIDLGAGGNFGPRPNYTSWTSNQPYVRSNGILLLLEAPMLFNFLVDTNKYIESLTAMFELHSRTVTGLSQAKTAATEAIPLGGGGETMEVVTNVTVEPTQLQIGYNELRGSPISRLNELWMEMGTMHHETKNPLIMFSEEKIKTIQDRKGVTMTPEWSNASLIFIEPDPSGMAAEFTNIIGGVMPKSNGDRELRKDIVSDLPVISQDIGYTGFSDISPSANFIGQKLLDVLNNSQINPDYRRSFISEVAADVKAYGVNSGYESAGSQ